ncbi:MAG: YceI family protein [Candidatus Nanopelagicales bacterium]
MADLSAANGTWVIDAAHTNIGFTARHLMVSKVRGSFAAYEGGFTIDAGNISASSANLTIQAASITTGSADRDGHLISPDFLDVENFPTLTFVSTGVTDKGTIVEVTGDLTIHGVTKSVVVPWEFIGVSTDPWGNTKAGFEAELEISREEFGLTWNAALETGGVLISDKIKLVLDVQALKA